MSTRTPLRAGDLLSVVDWAKEGWLFEVQTEDGPVVRAPDSRAVIELVTAYGYVYTLPIRYGTDFARAERAVRRILREGTVNLDKWVLERTVYGSMAYVADGEEAAWAARERWAA